MPSPWIDAGCPATYWAAATKAMKPLIEKITEKGLVFAPASSHGDAAASEPAKPRSSSSVRTPSVRCRAATSETEAPDTKQVGVPCSGPRVATIRRTMSPTVQGPSTAETPTRQPNYWPLDLHATGAFSTSFQTTDPQGGGHTSACSGNRTGSSGKYMLLLWIVKAPEHHSLSIEVSGYRGPGDYSQGITAAVVAPISNHTWAAALAFCPPGHPVGGLAVLPPAPQRLYYRRFRRYYRWSTKTLKRSDLEEDLFK